MLLDLAVLRLVSVLSGPMAPAFTVGTFICIGNASTTNGAPGLTLIAGDSEHQTLGSMRWKTF
jgi:hypothetical protein